MVEPTAIASGTAWTVGTARLMALCWLTTLAARILFRRDEVQSSVVRVVWTAGAILLAIHTWCALRYVHHGSHAEAWEHTARRTLEVTGWNWGGGLLINELMLVAWLCDTGALWSKSPRWAMSARCRWTVHAAFGFLMINATVVFGPPFYRPVAGFVAAAALLTLAGRRLHS